jgi:hypothetical protein
MQTKSNMYQAERETIRHLMLTWQILLQILWMNIITQVTQELQDLKTRLIINIFLPSKKFCNGQT